MQKVKYILSVLIVGLMFSCGGEKVAEAEKAAKQKEIIKDVAKKNASASVISQVTAAMTPIVESYAKGELDDQLNTTSSGLKYMANRLGRGAHPQKGDMVNVHYYGVLPNGQKFDSSFDKMAPFSFRLGEGEVIKGWDEGIALMKEGGNFIFFIPPHLAYGDQGIPQGGIAGDQELIFFVALNGFHK